MLDTRTFTLMIFLVSAVMLTDSCAATCQSISEQDFFAVLMESKNNSSQSFRLVKESDKYYIVDERSSLIDRRTLKIEKHSLVIACENNKLPCDIKVKFVKWKD